MSEERKNATAVEVAKDDPDYVVVAPDARDYGGGRGGRGGGTYDAPPRRIRLARERNQALVEVATLLGSASRRVRVLEDECDHLRHKLHVAAARHEAELADLRRRHEDVLAKWEKELTDSELLHKELRLLKEGVAAKREREKARPKRKKATPAKAAPAKAPPKDGPNMTRQPWNPMDDEVLRREKRAGLSFARIATRLGRSREAVAKRWRRMAAAGNG